MPVIHIYICIWLAERRIIQRTETNNSELITVLKIYGTHAIFQSNKTEQRAYFPATICVCFVTFVFVFVLCHISTFSFLFCFGGTAVAVCLSASYLSIAAVQLDLILCFSFIFYEKAWNQQVFISSFGTFNMLSFAWFFLNSLFSFLSNDLQRVLHYWSLGSSSIHSHSMCWT